ncbi:triose-phosphate isomerase [Peijinzhouia sedimentorum]
MRTKIIAGNWKMNNDFDAGLKLASEVFYMVNDEIIDPNIKVIMAPPYIHLEALSRRKPINRKLAIAAQNCSEHSHGAYTGEVSAGMIKSTGAEYIIIGHSERRAYHNESSGQLANKVNQALGQELTPIFCCGEELSIREANTHIEFVKKQIEEGLFHLDAESFKQVVIAYEPVWAIGTGKTASSAQAQEMHANIRECIAKKYGKEIAGGISILYGGSCNPGNAAELFAQADVDGGLIGGASLKSRDFLSIAKALQNS